MPTPLGHTLAGIAIQFAARDPRAGRAWPSMPMLVALANLADVDFIAGYFVGHPSAYHWGPTHSLTAAVLVGSIAGALMGANTGRYVASIIWATTAYASHILLDLLLGQTGAPSLGLQVFWPFSRERLLLPWSVFKMAPISIRTNPIATLFSLEILPVIARELMVMLPVVLVSWTMARAYRSGEFTYGKRG